MKQAQPASWSALGWTQHNVTPYVALCVCWFSPREWNADRPVYLLWTKNHSWSTVWRGCLFHVLAELPHQLCLSTEVPSRCWSPIWVAVHLHSLKKKSYWL